MFMDPCTIIYMVEKSPTRCDRIVEFIIPMFFNCPTCFQRHTAHHQELKNCNCSLWFYISLWLLAAVMAEWEFSFHSAMTAAGSQPQMYVKPEAAITVFELLMIRAVLLETCWAIKKLWNNKFYYTVASCWLFLYDSLNCTCQKIVLEYFVKLDINAPFLIPYFGVFTALAVGGRNFLNKSANIIFQKTLLRRANLPVIRSRKTCTCILNMGLF